MKSKLIKSLNYYPFIFSLCGMLLSVFMWYYKIRNMIPPCTLSGCGSVITGKYSMMFGIPVATFGFFYYAFLALLFFEAFFIKAKALKLLTILFLTAGWIYTIYLRYLEFAKIGDWCEWCWLSVLFMTIISLAYFIINRKERGD